MLFLTILIYLAVVRRLKACINSIKEQVRQKVQYIEQVVQYISNKLAFQYILCSLCIKIDYSLVDMAFMPILHTFNTLYSYRITLNSIEYFSVNIFLKDYTIKILKIYF